MALSGIKRWKSSSLSFKSLQSNSSPNGSYCIIHYQSIFYNTADLHKKREYFRWRIRGFLKILLGLKDFRFQQVRFVLGRWSRSTTWTKAWTANAKCQVCVGNGKWSDQSGVKYEKWICKYRIGTDYSWN